MQVYGVIVPQQPGCRYARQPPPADSADGAVQGMVQLLNAMYRKAVAAAGATAAGGDATAACGATGSSDRDVESEVLDPRAARAALLGLAKLQVGLSVSSFVWNMPVVSHSVCLQCIVSGLVINSKRSSAESPYA